MKCPSREELQALIASGLAEYDEEVRAEWERIRIEPEKWQCSPWGDEYGGFWAVAVDNERVLWFNHIEEGFNWSRYVSRGTIGEYFCDQDEFTEILESIEQAHSGRAREKLAENEVPGSIASPGTIVRRQTTYWEVRSARGDIYRIHFRDKVEFAFAVADYTSVELLARHPLLVDYDEPSRSLYFSGTPLRPRLLAESIDRVIRDMSDGWRGLANYADSLDAAERFLRVGHGLLMYAPESLCTAVAGVLDREGVSTSILGAARPPGDKRVLLLGRSYVIASAFAFERRN